MELGEKEIKLLNAMELHVSVKEAADSIGISPKYAGVLLSRLRKKMESCENFLDDLRSRMRKNRLVNKCLARRH